MEQERSYLQETDGPTSEFPLSSLPFPDSPAKFLKVREAVWEPQARPRHRLGILARIPWLEIFKTLFWVQMISTFVLFGDWYSSFVLCDFFAILILAIAVKDSPTKFPKLKKMMDQPGIKTQFPVRVTIYSGETILGLDEGFVTFSEDVLHLEGSQASFELFSSLIVSIRAYERRSFSSPMFSQGTIVGVKGLVTNGCSAAIEWRTANRKGRMVVYPYDRTSIWDRKRYARDFWKALDAWRNEPDRVHPSIVLPPRAAQKGYLTLAKFEYYLVAITSPFFVIVSPFVGWSRSHGALGASYFALSLVYALVFLVSLALYLENQKKKIRLLDELEWSSELKDWIPNPQRFR